MSIFISHVEENRATAEAIAQGLQEAGYEAWTYESSAVPGPTYLSQVINAIERASAMILVISPESLGSHQVAREIEAAHELDRPIIPVLYNISHEKYLQRRPEWRLALGAYTSVEIPKAGVAAIMPKIVGGLEALGVPKSGAQPGPAQTVRATASGASGQGGRPAWLPIAAGVLALAIVAVVLFLVLGRDGDEPSAAPQTPSSSATSPATTTTTPTTTSTATEVEGAASLSELSGALQVDPARVVGGEPIRLTYTVTNGSSRPVTAEAIEIVILVGDPKAGTSVLLQDISQEIAPGATARQAIDADSGGTDLGEQTVFIMVGERISGGSTNNRVIAEAPVTIAP